MRIVIQRVSEASVSVAGEVISKIEQGMLVLLGIEDADTDEDVEWLCNKLTKLRIFSDENDAMNLDINQIEGAFLVVSQFTLHAMTKKGNRPSFIKAARPEKAIPLYAPAPRRSAKETRAFRESNGFEKQLAQPQRRHSLFFHTAAKGNTFTFSTMGPEPGWQKVDS